jgi:hypothetical protein
MMTERYSSLRHFKGGSGRLPFLMVTFRVPSVDRESFLLMRRNGAMHIIAARHDRGRIGVVLDLVVSS